MIRRDGKPIFLSTSKSYSLTMQRKKAAKLVWTQAWRRLHKKGMTESTQKKRARRTNKVQRAVVGASLDEIRKRASQKSDFRAAQREAALKEIKARKQANKAKSTGGRSSGGSKPAKAFQKIPKHMGGSKSRGGTQR